MKKFLFSLFVFLCYLFPLSAQTNTATVIGEIDDNYFIWEARSKKKSGFYDLKDHLLLKYDKSLNLIIRKELNIEESSSERVERIMFFGNWIVVFNSVFNKREDKQFLTYQLIDPNTLQEQGPKLILAESVESKIAPISSFFLGLSDEGKKLLVLKETFRNIFKGVPKEFDISVFDQEFRLLWNRVENLPALAKGFSLENYDISDEGNVLMVGPARFDKDTVNTKLLKNYLFFEFLDNGQKYSVRNLGLEVANYYIVGQRVQFAVGKIFASGFFKIPEVRKQYGYFLQTYDIGSLQREKNYYEVLDKEYETIDEDETDPAVKETGKKGNDDMFAFDIKRIKLDQSGNTFLIGEQKNTYTVTTQYGTTTTVSYLDIYALKLDPDGKLIWELRIPKRQSFSPTQSKNTRDLSHFISYVPFIWNDYLLFFLNDNPENLNPGLKKPKSVKWKEAISQVLIVGKDGKVDRRAFSELPGNLIYTNFVYNLGDDRILVRSSLFKEYEESSYKIIDLKQFVFK
jgi:hypothetical protein